MDEVTGTRQADCLDCGAALVVGARGRLPVRCPSCDRDRKRAADRERYAARQLAAPVRVRPCRGCGGAVEPRKVLCAGCRAGRLRQRDRLKVQRVVAARPVPLCADCGAEVPRRAGSGGSQALRCGPCASAREKACERERDRVRRATLRAALPPRLCGDCGGAIPPGTKRRFCEPCARRRNSMSTQRSVRRRLASNAEARVAKTRRKNERRRARAAVDPEYAAKFRAQRKAHKATREAAGRAGIAVSGDVVSIEYLLERDNWRCGICRKKIAKTAVYPDPRSPSTDHIIPLARGGLHVRENLQPAHLDCNIAKSDRGGGQLLLVG